jgi:hypothetical protein
MQVLSGLGVTAFYAFSFWRLAQRNHGSKVIEFGGMAFALCFVLPGLLRIPNLPAWLLLLFLCFTTVFLFVQQTYREIRKRK